MISMVVVLLLEAHDNLTVVLEIDMVDVDMGVHVFGVAAGVGAIGTNIDTVVDTVVDDTVVVVVVVAAAVAISMVDWVVD